MSSTSNVPPSGSHTPSNPSHPSQEKPKDHSWGKSIRAIFSFIGTVFSILFSPATKAFRWAAKVTSREKLSKESKKADDIGSGSLEGSSAGSNPKKKVSLTPQSLFFVASKLDSKRGSGLVIGERREQNSLKENEESPQGGSQSKTKDSKGKGKEPRLVDDKPVLWIKGASTTKERKEVGFLGLGKENRQSALSASDPSKNGDAIQSSGNSENSHLGEAEKSSGRREQLSIAELATRMKGETRYDAILAMVNASGIADEELKGLRAVDQCKIKLALYLQEKGKCFGSSIDNGDCFYDSMAQVLTQALQKGSPHLKENLLLQKEALKEKGIDSFFLNENLITLKDLKILIKNYVDELNVENPNDNWVKERINSRKGVDTGYNDYMEYVGLTSAELSDPIHVIWGEPYIDGEIISKLLGVEICVYEAQTDFDFPEDVKSQYNTTNNAGEVTESSNRSEETNNDSEDLSEEEGSESIEGMESDFEDDAFGGLDFGDDELEEVGSRDVQEGKEYAIEPTINRFRADKSKTCNVTVEIGVWPGHYVPIFDQANS